MSASDSDDPLCIHAKVKIIGESASKFETKILLNDGNEKFVDVIKSVLTEYAQERAGVDSDSDDDRSGHDSDKEDPVKVAVQGFMSLIKSITSGRSTCNLCKFLEKNKTKIKTINDAQTPIYTKGIAIELHTHPQGNKTAANKGGQEIACEPICSYDGGGRSK